MKSHNFYAVEPAHAGHWDVVTFTMTDGYPCRVVRTYGDKSKAQSVAGALDSIAHKFGGWAANSLEHSMPPSELKSPLVARRNRIYSR